MYACRQRAGLRRCGEYAARHGPSQEADLFNSSSFSNARVSTTHRCTIRKTWPGFWPYTPATLWSESKSKRVTASGSSRALEDALGMKFVAETGEHFLRLHPRKTLFYGVFSAWVRWHKDNPGPDARFDWRTAEWSLHVPFVRTLYEEAAGRGGSDRWDWLTCYRQRECGFESMPANSSKISRTRAAVQYFYEPFLEAFDPERARPLEYGIRRTKS